MMGFKSFRSAAATIAGVELMHMIRKGQWQTTGNCAQHNSSIHWRDNPVHRSRPNSVARKICDMCGRPLRRKKNLLDGYGA
jgi:hypothetical protein